MRTWGCVEDFPLAAARATLRVFSLREAESLATLLDATIARLTRACSTDPGDAEAVTALERALLQAGRTVDAFLLRWRRGEPSPVAAQLAAAQRPALEALARRFGEPACPGCGLWECGLHRLDVASDREDDWLPVENLQAEPSSPITALRVVGLAGAEDVKAIAALGPLVELHASIDGGRPAAGLGALPLERLQLELVGRPSRLDGLPPVHELTLMGRVTDEVLESLARCAPGVEALSIDAQWSTEDGLKELARLPRLQRLTVMRAVHGDGSFVGRCADAGSALRELVLDRGGLTERALFGAADLRGLEALEVHEGECVTEDGLAAIVGAPKLRDLALFTSELPEGGADLLAEGTIERLRLYGGTQLDARTLAAIARLPALTELGCTLRIESGARSALAELGHACRLERLRLRPLNDDLLLGLASLPRLRDLDLSYESGISEQGFRALRDAPCLARLELTGRRTPPGELEAVAALPRLEALDLRGCRLTGGLAGLSTARALDRLDLRGADLGAEGGRCLARFGVSWLALDVSALDGVTLAALADAPRLGHLVVAGLVPEGLTRLRAALPWVDVRRPGAREEV